MLVQTERRHRVEVITINRPEARNAIDDDTSKALADAFDAATAPNEGPRAFAEKREPSWTSA